MKFKGSIDIKQSISVVTMLFADPKNLKKDLIGKSL